MRKETYTKAKALMLEASSEYGFLASTTNVTNYKRIWARDGVICGLAGLLDGDVELGKTFKQTLYTLANHQHKLGNIPSNVFYDVDGVKTSFGGLAGRVDTVSWFIIGVCNYAFFYDDDTFFKQMKPHLKKGFKLLDAWEFNTNHLIYVPRSGNWADEYITEGHILYDQLLRLWALRCYAHFSKSKKIKEKIYILTQKLRTNYVKEAEVTRKELYHPKAYEGLAISEYWQASINPSGYQTMYDAFANSLAILLDLSPKFNDKVIAFSERLRKQLSLKLLPAFWNPITSKDSDWQVLSNNCKYEFRNKPYEFHNGGTWQMVNGFYAAAISDKKPVIAEEIEKHISVLNATEDYSFYENFNTKTGSPNGTPYCTWSAAGEIIATQYINGKKMLI